MNDRFAFTYSPKHKLLIWRFTDATIDHTYRLVDATLVLKRAITTYLDNILKPQTRKLLKLVLACLLMHSAKSSHKFRSKLYLWVFIEALFVIMFMEAGFYFTYTYIFEIYFSTNMFFYSHCMRMSILIW